MGKYRILVVDDDPLLLELACDILSAEEDLELFGAVDGLDGWEKALQCRPDLVITDLMMPKMHGYELCEKLKGPEGLPGVKIIVASSKPFATDRAQALASGADSYVVKPYPPQTLLKEVRAMLQQAGQPAAPSAVSAGPLEPAPPHAAPPPPAPRPQPAPLPAPVPLASGGGPAYVRFWGTRGSCPISNPSTVRYGGNTPCTEVRIGDQLIIMDCGTGLRELGASLMKEFRGRPLAAHIFVGHTHWDHIQGFPFFAPLYNPANQFTLYSVHGAHGTLESVFSGAMAGDYFPVPLASLAGKVRFVEMSGTVDLGAAKVSYCHLNHPGVAIGFRIDAGGRSVAYLSDHEEFVRLNGDNDMARRLDDGINDFVKGCDLLIREAQYTEDEYAPRKGWGHSTFGDAVRCAAKAGVKKLAVFHHDPEHTDEMMDGHIAYCRALAVKLGAEVDCFGAADGLRVDL